MKRIPLLILLCLFVTTGAFAKDLYVAKDGNDSVTYAINNISNPWRTIDYGVDNMQVGDILYIRGGTYNEAVTISSGGTSGAYKTIRAYTGETVILDGQDSLGTGINLNNSAADYVKIIGLEIKNYTAYGIINGTYTSPRGTNYIEVRDCNIHHNGTSLSAYYSANILFQDVNHITIDNCELHHAKEWSLIFAGVTASTLSNSVIYFTARDNLAGADVHGFFNIFNSTGNTFHDNYFYMYQKSVRTTENNSANTWYNNVFAYMGFTGLDVHGGGGDANSIIKNNIFAYNPIEGSNPKGSQVTGLKYWNNVFYRCGYIVIMQNESSGNHNIQNNIFSTGRYGLYFDSGTIGTHDYNDYYGLATNIVGDSLDTHAQTVDPEFTDAGNFDFSTAIGGLQNTGNNPSGDCDEIGLCTNFVDSSKIIPFRALSVSGSRYSPVNGTPSKSIDGTVRHGGNGNDWVPLTSVDYIVYDMGETYSVQYFALSGSGGKSVFTNWPNTFDIYISDDPDTGFVKIVTDATPATPSNSEWYPLLQYWETDSGASHSGRYIKFDVTSNKASTTTISEFMVMGPVPHRPRPPTGLTIIGQ